jgi:carbamoyl-phosphate synthase large subunit
VLRADDRLRGGEDAAVDVREVPGGDETLTTQMKSVGEGMAIGRTFKEELAEVIRSMEMSSGSGLGLDRNDAWLRRRVVGSSPQTLGENDCPLSNVDGLFENEHRTLAEGGDLAAPVDGAEAPVIGGSTAAEAPADTEEEHAQSWPIPDAVLRDKLVNPCQGRLYYIRYAFKMGWSVAQVNELTRIDPWFLEHIRELAESEPSSEQFDSRSLCARGSYFVALADLKRLGYSDVQIASALGLPVDDVSVIARHENVAPVYKLVDTCAAEFEASTPYYYSAHESGMVHIDGGTVTFDDEIRVTDRPKIVVLGGGPNRIGQGIEFDYCCCHASFAAREAGYESVMINSNPETVSTDYDTSDLLFFEPLTHEDVLNVIERLNGMPMRPIRSADDAAGAWVGEHVAKREGEAPAEPLQTKQDRADRTSQILEGGHGPPYVAPEEPKGHVRGVIVQFGGQTPLNLAQGLKDAGVPILGTQPEMIHLAEDRDAFQRVLRELSLLQPPNGIARNPVEARAVAERIGYPVLVRPSYVLGGRGMKVCNNEGDLKDFLREAFGASDRSAMHDDNPILIDKFLVDAIEVDVDAVADFGRCDEVVSGRLSLTRRNALGPSSATDPLSRSETSASQGGATPQRESLHSPYAPHSQRESLRNPRPMCMVAGIMEHIEEAGIHSGDSTCVLPPFSLGRAVIEELFRSTRRLAERLSVCGVMNVQYAILNRTVYVLEVNPRASRTLPFVAKATGVPWARIATRVMLGEPLAEVLDAYGISETPWPRHTAIKAPVFPFDRFAGADVILGPEMRSTGEAMSIDSSFGRSFAKAQIATGLSLPTSGNVLVSVNDPDKPRIVSIARDLYDMGFSIYSTTGTRRVLAECGIPTTLVSKSTESGAPFLKDLIEDGTLHLLINTPIRTGPVSAEGRWRAAAFARRVPLITTIAGARAAVAAIRALRENEHGEVALPLGVKSLQAYFGREHPLTDFVSKPAGEVMQASNRGRGERAVHAEGR